METGVGPSVVTTKYTFPPSANLLRDQIPGHFGQYKRTTKVFFSQFSDEHRVNWKTFARADIIQLLIG
jgi:hypothetical protein